MIDQSQYERTLRDARLKLSEGWDVESIIEYLKECEFSQIACIRAVADLGICSAAEAKRVVHFSHAWSPMRKQNEALHQALVEEVDSEFD
jgi:hypothetical protein